MPAANSPSSGLPSPRRRASRHPGSRRTRRTIALTLALVVGSGAALAACSQSVEPVAEPVASSAGAETPVEESPTPVEPPKPTNSPLSGRKGGIGTPVAIVKLDNTPQAQPHVGLTAADVVYVEPVEWGLTRLAAVYSTRVPSVVGPVRSARISDIDIAAPYGNVAFVFSGAQQRLWPSIRRAHWTELSEDIDSPGFFRDRSRYMPVNLMAQPQQMLANNPGVAVSKDMGLVFDNKAPAGGQAATTLTATWENARIQFKWNKTAKAYDVWMHGRPARASEAPGVQRASTVIVQYVQERDSGYGDKFGGRTPLAVTIGSGSGLALRDGRSYPITWKRAKQADSTQYLDASGEPIALDPGQIWIVLKDRTKKVSVTPAPSKSPTPKKAPATSTP